MPGISTVWFSHTQDWSDPLSLPGIAILAETTGFALLTEAIVAPMLAESVGSAVLDEDPEH